MLKGRKMELFSLKEDPQLARIFKAIMFLVKEKKQGKEIFFILWGETEARLKFKNKHFKKVKTTTRAYVGNPQSKQDEHVGSNSSFEGPISCKAVRHS